MVHTSQLVATGQINRETIKIEKKRWVKIEFWSTPELIAHREDDFYFKTTHILVLLKPDSLRTSYSKHNKIYFF